MENQNNNKNGLLGLAILIGVAILVAVFCTPFVAHAETVTNIEDLAKFTKYPCVGKNLEGHPSGTFRNTQGADFIVIYVNGNDKFYTVLCPYYEGYTTSHFHAEYPNYNGQELYYQGLGTIYSGEYTFNGCRYYYLNFSADVINITTPYSISGNYTFGPYANQCYKVLQDIANDSVSIADSNVKGSEENPEYDEDIGRVVFTNVYINSSEGILNQGYLASDIVLQWKNKTSTGQSLNDYYDKYTTLTYDYIIENLCSYTQRYTKEQIKFSTYGQKSTIKGSTAYRPELWIYSSELNSSFENWDSDLMKSIQDGTDVDIKFRVYVRPKFAKNTLTVIPDPSSAAEWVCGRWNSVVVSNLVRDPNEKLDNESGEFDDDDNWIGDDNEPDDINSGHITSSDRDDFYDKLQTDIDISDYVSNISALAEEVKVIPLIIGKLLSFLPSWVLTLIALSFGTICVLMIIKFIRG